ncbi:MAG: Asp23/Gls24 family envelope stress response protein [Oscillospiraceae bacterium]
MGENSKDYVTHPDDKGSINISEEVIAVIAANAALETEGVASLSASLGKDIAERLGKRNQTKGVRIAVEDEIILVDVYIMVKMGVSVSKVGVQVQEAVASNIESMTGFSVAEVNVHVCGIAFDRDR